MSTPRTNPTIFKFFKTAGTIAFIIEPICEDKEIDDPENPGKKKTIRECLPHSDNPEALASLFDDLRDMIAKKGFEVEVLGPPKAMAESLMKKQKFVKIENGHIEDFGVLELEGRYSEIYAKK